MTVRKLFVVKHVGTDGDQRQRQAQAMLGCAPAQNLFDLIQVKKNSEDQPPRRFDDYAVMALKDKVPAGVVLLDLATTGLDPVSCRIVEFGAVRFKLFKGELHHFEQRVDPECPIPSDAARIHGITDAMVRGMPTVAETLPIVLGFLGRLDTVLLAHNAPL